MVVVQHSMIFFFHRYELPALLEQIRQQQQQQPPRNDQQAASGHAGPDNNAPSADNSDRSSSEPTVDTDAEEQHAGASDDGETDLLSTDMDDGSHQLLVVNRALAGTTAAGRSEADVSHGGTVVKTPLLSAASPQPVMSLSSSCSTSDDFDRGEVDGEEAHVHCDRSSLQNHVATDSFVSTCATTDSATELRQRRLQPSELSSRQGFSSHQAVHTDCTRVDLSTTSAEVLSGHENVLQNSSNHPR